MSVLKKNFFYVYILHKVLEYPMNEKKDEKGVVISISRVYADVNHDKGPSWYEHKNFEPEWNDPDNYFLKTKVGRGKYSTVFRAVDKDRKECAIKVLVPLETKRYYREIKILSNLAGQKNIVFLKDLVRDPATGIYSFVFEWVEFDDWKHLYSTFELSDIRLYLFKLLDALDTSHSLGIMHRDVKPQNIAIDKSHRKLRLIDWGLADFYFPGAKYNSHVATRVFKPPELLIEYPYYDYSMDIWSAGLTFSIMLFRKIVINCGEDDEQQLYNVAQLVGGPNIVAYAKSLGVNLKKEKVERLYNIVGAGWDKHVNRLGSSCPREAIDLLKKMMTIDHRERITAAEAKRHPFFEPLFREN